MNLTSHGTLIRDRGSDLLVSLGLVTLAIYVNSAAGRFSDLGAIFPRAVALMIAVLGVGLLLSVLLPRAFFQSRWSAWRRKVTQGEQDVPAGFMADDAAAMPVTDSHVMAETSAETQEDSVTATSLPAYSVIAGLVLWVALMPEIGFVIASTLGLIAFSLAILERDRWTRRNIVVLLLFSVITPAVIHFVMSEYLLVPLP